MGVRLRLRPARRPASKGLIVKYPIKLDDSYTCQGIDADGETVIFNDLLSEGDGVGPWDEEQEAAVFMDAIVVRRDDGLWVVADERRPDRPALVDPRRKGSRP